MDQSYFQPLLEATDFLSDRKTHDALLQMQTVYQQKLYFVALIGQYSAGKSCLLNSLLKRQLLPEGTTETTPLLTYLRYGEREEAKLHYTDGAIQILEIEQIARLSQQAEGGRWDLTHLDFLEVYLHEELLRSGMILLDTPGVNTLIERHEQLLESSLSMASGIVYVTGRAPTHVDMDKLSMLADAGFDVSFVRTHCDEIKEQEETLEQVRAADQIPLAECGIGPERCYYVSNRAKSPLFAALEPLRRMLMEKGSRANAELESSMERQLFVQAGRCQAALEQRRTLLEQANAKNTELLENRRKKVLDQIRRMETRLTDSEANLRKRVELCRQTLQEDVKHQLESAIQRSGERIEANTAISDENEMAALLRRETAKISRNACQLMNAVLDPLVQEVSDAVPNDLLELETLSLPQAAGYQALCASQDEQTADLRNRLTALREEQENLTQTLAAKVDSPEYRQLQQEFQELQDMLVEIQQTQANLPPYEPQMMIADDGRMQPSQLARSIGAAADWLLLLIPGTQIESVLVKTAAASKNIKALGKMTGILEKTAKAAKGGDTIKDILFSLKNLNEHTRTSKRREKIALDAVSKAARNVGKGVDTLRDAKQNQNEDTASILDLLTIEHWAGKIGEMFDRPPHLIVDQEYEEQYKAAKAAIEDKYREQQRKIYQKKLEMGLLQKEEERLRAKEESLRNDQEAVLRELSRKEAELQAAANREALKKWRRDCSVWYQEEWKRNLQNAIDAYTENFPVRLEAYQRQRLEALRDALAKEQAFYDDLKNAPADEVALELQRVNELSGGIHNVFYK